MGNNPLTNHSNHKYGAVPFDDIKLEHFIPALDYAIEEAEKSMEIIEDGQLIINHIIKEYIKTVIE